MPGASVAQGTYKHDAAALGELRDVVAPIVTYLFFGRSDTGHAAEVLDSFADLQVHGTDLVFYEYERRFKGKAADKRTRTFPLSTRPEILQIVSACFDGAAFANEGEIGKRKNRDPSASWWRGSSPSDARGSEVFYPNEACGSAVAKHRNAPASWTRPKPESWGKAPRAGAPTRSALTPVTRGFCTRASNMGARESPRVFNPAPSRARAAPCVWRAVAVNLNLPLCERKVGVLPFCRGGGV